MTDETSGEGLKARIARQGEDTLGKLAQEMLENPLINSAITRAFEAREKAAQAQEVAMGALNLPSASDIERLTRRVRAVSQRLEGIEDGLDRLEERLASVKAEVPKVTDDGVSDRLGAIEEQLNVLHRDLGAITKAIASEHPIPREQERLEVESK
jgi:CRP-like cAMP-binding protein